MKKFTAVFITLVLLVGVFCVPMSTSAATKQELIDVFETIPVSKYMHDDVIKLSKTREITEEQGDYLMALLLKLKALLPVNKGSSAHSYTELEREQILAIVKEACDYMDCRIDFIPSKNSHHADDIMFVIYDETGKLIFSYDGDAVAKTGEVEDSTSTYVFLFAGIAVLAAAAFMAAYKKKLA